MLIAACVKWIDLRPEVDHLTGEVTTDPRTHGASPADEAAVETALRIAAAWGGEVVVVGAGPPAVKPMLLQLAATGGCAVRHLDMPIDVGSHAVGAAIAAATDDCDLVVCGNVSLDRGSGSVPAFVAAGRENAQALGLVAVDWSEPGRLEVHRRLGGGRTEVLRVSTPAVISVEGSVASLRRAPLDAIVRASELGPSDSFRANLKGPIREGGGDASVAADNEVVLGPLQPWRPRARVLSAPTGDDARDRILELTGALVDRTPPRVVEADPAEAAVEIIDQLRAWGYLA
jgi:electron transfer flavoprotein beta subunit